MKVSHLPFATHTEIQFAYFNFHIAHQTERRKRFRLSILLGNSALSRALEQRLLQEKNVLSAHARSSTGSLIVKHEAGQPFSPEQLHNCLDDLGSLPSCSSFANIPDSESPLEPRTTQALVQAKLRKSIKRLVRTNLREIALVIIPLAAKRIAPLNSIQIFGLNLLTDILPTLTSLLLEAPRPKAVIGQLQDTTGLLQVKKSMFGLFTEVCLSRSSSFLTARISSQFGVGKFSTISSIVIDLTMKGIQQTLTASAGARELSSEPKPRKKNLYGTFSVVLVTIALGLISPTLLNYGEIAVAILNLVGPLILGEVLS